MVGRRGSGISVLERLVYIVNNLAVGYEMMKLGFAVETKSCVSFLMVY